MANLIGNTAQVSWNALTGDARKEHIMYNEHWRQYDPEVFMAMYFPDLGYSYVIVHNSEHGGFSK